MRGLIGLLLLVATATSAADYSRETNQFSLWTDGQQGRAVDKSGRLQGAQLATLCQRALLLPYESELRNELASRIRLSIPEGVSFSTASIVQFRHEQSGNQADCSGRVEPGDHRGDLEETALRALWALRPEPESSDFDRILGVIDERRDMDNDLLVYVSSFMRAGDARDLLQHIDPALLKTPGARQFVQRLGL